MDLQSLDIEQLKSVLAEQLEKVKSLSDLDLLKRDWLGKEGTLKTLFKQLGQLDAERRPTVAAGLNTIKATLEEFIQTESSKLKSQSMQAALTSERLDMSLPASDPGVGRIHPITFVNRKLTRLLQRYGFEVIYGPEIETEYFCFDALNIPPHHPARDMQDTFYTSTGHVLRTHTSSVQARVLREGKLPVKAACPGRVYRNETEDAQHTAMFHQYDIIWVEHGLTLSHLMGLMSQLVKDIYGKRRKVRFVPKFYPYTEPSIGVEVSSTSMSGERGWVTVEGPGMVHRNVLLEFDYDPNQATGFAFGLGVMRLAAEHCHFASGKMLYENDLRIMKDV